jgi:hypothetical protein
MSNELESERAMVVIELWWRFRVIGADGVEVGYYCETETESPSSTTPQRRSCFRSLRSYVSCLSAVFVFVTLEFADMI